MRATLFGVGLAGLAILPMLAQAPAPSPAAPSPGAPPQQGGAAQPGTRGGRAQGRAGRGPGGDPTRGNNRAPDGIPLSGMPPEGVDKAPMIFHEGWAPGLPLAQPTTQEHLANQFLRMHLYGDSANIRASNHDPDYYTYTGETRWNWALTVSDGTRFMNFNPLGKIRWETKQSGYRFLHVMLKGADGSYYISEEGDGESVDWRTTEWFLRDLHWRNLVVGFASVPARWGGGPQVQSLAATTPAKPDLSKVDEIGFSDLMPGGLIPSSSRVRWFEVYANWVPR